VFVELPSRVNQDEASRILAVTAWWKTLPIDCCNFVRGPVGLVVENLVNSGLLADFAGLEILAFFRGHLKQLYPFCDSITTHYTPLIDRILGTYALLILSFVWGICG
jgi:hypothetical protein